MITRLRRGGGAVCNLAPTPPEPQATPTGYSPESTSTTGNSTRASEAAEGAGALPVSRKLPAPVRTFQRSLDTAEALYRPRLTNQSDLGGGGGAAEG